MPDEEVVEPVELATVKNVGASIFDLDDGRELAPGAVADGVNVAHPHNQRLVTAGLLHVRTDEAEPPAKTDKTSVPPAKKED